MNAQSKTMSLLKVERAHLSPYKWKPEFIIKHTFSQFNTFKVFPATALSHAIFSRLFWSFGQNVTPANPQTNLVKFITMKSGWKLHLFFELRGYYWYANRLVFVYLVTVIFYLSPLLILSSWNIKNNCIGFKILFFFWRDKSAVTVHVNCLSWTCCKHSWQGVCPWVKHGGSCPFYIRGRQWMCSRVATILGCSLIKEIDLGNPSLWSNPWQVLCVTVTILGD